MELHVTRIFRRNQKTQAKIVVNRGGTRSSKSYSLAQLAAIWLISGKLQKNDTEDTKGVWTILRKTLPALKATAMRDFIEILTELDVINSIHQNKTDFLFHYRGRTVEFMSLDDQQKIRSRKRDYAHICESNEVSYNEFIQLAIRTRKRIYLDFNPDDPNIWIRTEIEEKRAQEMGDVEVIVSTYKDNDYLMLEERLEIEYLERIDPDLWKVFGTGEYGEARGLVYDPPTIIDVMPTNIETVYGGIDWGYTFDPTAVVVCGVDGNNLYIDEVLYSKGLINTEIYSRLPKGILYIADSAEPKSIEDLSRLGARIIPSLKGPDSVRQGIGRVREFKIHVTAKSVNLIKEFRNYKYSDDGEPVDRYNHGLDALRYIVQTKLKHNREYGESQRAWTPGSNMGYKSAAGRMV